MSRLINPHVHLKRDLVVGDYIRFIATDANCRAEGTIIKIVSPTFCWLGRTSYIVKGANSRYYRAEGRYFEIYQSDDPQRINKDGTNPEYFGERDHA